MPAKRLYRSHADRKLGGVCGGIAEYFEIDPVFVRLGAVLLALLNGFGLIAYLVALIVIPSAPGPRVEARTDVGPSGAEASPADDLGSPHRATDSPRTGNGGLTGGLILIAIGLFFLAVNMGVFHWDVFRFWRWRVVWPLVLIAIGLYLLSAPFRSSRAGRGA